MTKKEWIDVFDSIWNKARADYDNSDRFSKEENASYIIMTFAQYASDAIKELP